jgi:hypothetical protein
VQTNLELFREFEKKFRKPRYHPAPPAPVPISNDEVDALERTLRCHLPKSYREFVTNIGPCRVGGLCDAWLFKDEAQRDIPVAFESLWSPEEIIAQCEQPWHAPIPAELAGGSPVPLDLPWKYLIPFAGDDGGHWHCFGRQDSPTEDSAVYFFDHDGGDISKIALGLVDLIRAYMQLKR